MSLLCDTCEQIWEQKIVNFLNQPLKRRLVLCFSGGFTVGIELALYIGKALILKKAADEDWFQLRRAINESSSSVSG